MPDFERGPRGIQPVYKHSLSRRQPVETVADIDSELIAVKARKCWHGVDLLMARNFCEFLQWKNWESDSFHLAL